ILLRIQIRLREVEMALREAWVHLDRPAIRVDLSGSIGEMFVELTEVEFGLKARRMQLDFFLVLGNRAPKVVPLLGDERQIEMREPHVGLLLDRGSNFALRA